MPVYADPIDGLVIQVNLLQAWTARLVESLGTPPDIAADVADVLVASDPRGIDSHGTARLPNNVALIEAGVMDLLR
jgi:LDH2 family malate/lactate/ureidoglycolate dehydrogenase